MAIINVTRENFNQEVVASPVPVILDFWATWCGYCIRLAPVLEELARDYNGKITIAKIDVDQQPELTAQFAVEVFPTLHLIQNGKKGAEPAIGAQSKAQLEAWLKRNGAIS